MIVTKHETPHNGITGERKKMALWSNFMQILLPRQRGVWSANAYSSLHFFTQQRPYSEWCKMHLQDGVPSRRWPAPPGSFAA